jgi:hypothetical protein
MSNILLAWQNRTDAGTLSGGSWNASLPLTNLQNRLVQKVARSSSAALAHTKFDIDLGSLQSIGVLSLVVHNISTSGKVRLTGDDANTFASPIYQTAWIDVWPAGMIPQSLLEWEEDNFWLGTLSEQARAGYQSPFIHELPAPQFCRYWRVEIDDTGNSDGYVHIGRLFLSPTWRSDINYDLGAGLGYDDPTPVETSLSGAEYFDVRGKAREFNFTLGGLTATDAYDRVLQLQRVAGISGEVLMVPDADDTARLPARAWVGRLKQIGRIVDHGCDRFSADFSIREFL